MCRQLGEVDGLGVLACGLLKRDNTHGKDPPSFFQFFQNDA